MNTQQTVPVPVDASVPTQGFRRIVTDWAIGTGIALGLISVAYLIHQALGGPLVVGGPGGTSTEVTFGNISGMTVFGGSIGAALAYALGRWAPRPRAAFLTTCGSALVGYAVVPFVAAEAVSTAIWLNAFHLAVAIPVVGFLARNLPTARTRSDT